jgi:SNF2 family DNA or RNA helicase
VVEYIIGDVPDKEREDIKTRYKAGEVDVLVATPGTVGVGLNLQIANVEYFLSNDYSFVTREQTEGRVYRAGQRNERCVFVDFIARGTIDERVYAVLREKKDLLEYMRGKSIGEFLGGRASESF